METARIAIDMRNPQMFPRRVGFGETPGKQAAGLLQTVETQRGFGTLMEHDANLRAARILVAANLIPSGYSFLGFGGS
jgi:hypothetical protein